MKLEGTIMEMDHDVHIAANIRYDMINILLFYDIKMIIYDMIKQLITNFNKSGPIFLDIKN
jgi:hypothetical protein